MTEISESTEFYINKQVGGYIRYRNRNQPAANDCLYRIASHMELLTPEQSSYTPEIGEIALTWLRAHGWRV